MRIKSLTHVCFPEDKEDDESIIKSNQIRDLRETGKDICLFTERLCACFSYGEKRRTNERVSGLGEVNKVFNGASVGSDK